MAELTATQASSSKEIAYLKQEVENYSARVLELEKANEIELEKSTAAKSRESHVISEKLKEKELHDKELERLRKEKKELEKTIDDLNEVCLANSILSNSSW